MSHPSFPATFFLAFFFVFLNSLSKPRKSVLTSESVSFLVNNLYAEAVEAVKSRAPLSASTSVLISSLVDIK
jgi:hypothetical protein